MLLRTLCLGLLLCALSSAATLAAPTDLHPFFGSGGQVQDPFVSAGRVSRLDGRALAISRDLRTYIVGGANGGAGLPESGFIGVLLENGSIASDVGASNSGVRLLSNAIFEDLVLLPDGAVLVCGRRYLSLVETRWIVARFRADLSLDTGFASGGVYEGEFGPQSVCHAIDQLSDGRIAVTGAAFVGSSPRGFVAVLRSDGLTLDSGFGGNGLVELSAPNGLRPAGVDLVEGIDETLWVMAGNSFGPEPADAISNHMYRLSLEAASLSREYGDQSKYSPFPASAGRLAINPRGQLRRYTQRGTSPWQQSSWPVWEAFGAMAFLNPGSQSHSGVVKADRNDLGLVDLNGYVAGDIVLLPEDRALTLSAFRNASPPSGSAQARLVLRMFRNQINPADNGFSPGPFLFQPAGQPATGTDPWPLPRAVAIAWDGRITVLSRRSSGQNGVTVTRFTGEGPPGSGEFQLQPNLGTFPAASGPLNAERESEEQVVTGLSDGVRVPMHVLGGEYSLNGGFWTRRPTYVINGDRIRLRGRAPGQPNTSHSVALFIGGLRAKNSWDSIGPRTQRNFVITALQNPLPGVRCSSVFNASNCSGSIPDGSGSLVSVLPIDYVIPSQCNHVRSVKVALDIEHPRVGDLRVILQDPNAPLFGSDGKVSLIERPAESATAAPGSCAAAHVLAVIGDGFPRSVDTACALAPNTAGFSSELSPNEPLVRLVGRRGTNLNGTSSIGSWTLVVRDMAAGQAGQLIDWAIDVQCSDTPPPVADLALSVNGQTVAFPGAPMDFGFTVSNLGPNAATALFSAALPEDLEFGYQDVSWTCTGTGGASCNLPSGCQLLGCINTRIERTLVLPANSSATISITTTPNPGITTSGFGAALRTQAAVRVAESHGGPVDNQPGNNSAVHEAGLILLADMAAKSLTAVVAETGQIELRASFANRGPSRAPGSRNTLDLPPGYVITSFDCRRGELACGVFPIAASDQQLVLDSLGVLGDDQDNQIIVRAAFQGAAPPAGQITFSTELQLPPLMFGSDPNPNNNSLTLPTPSGPADLIFRNGFQ